MTRQIAIIAGIVLALGVAFGSGVYVGRQDTQTSLPDVTPTATPQESAKPTNMPSSKKIQQSERITLIDLTNWKITLPTGANEKPEEIKQPELNTYQVDPWFVVTPDGKGLRFRAPVNGVTTSGSSYPRSELREMTDDGKEKASWSSSSGTHTMKLDQAITALPKTKPHVVAGQIHDADDDVIVIRLEGQNLYVNVDGDNVHTLDSAYSLGKRFTVAFVAHDGLTDVYYNDSSEPVYTLTKSYASAYFKTGAYTQSNCSREEPSLCTDENYGEVIVYAASVTHK